MLTPPLRRRSVTIALAAVLALLALTPCVASAQQAPLQFGAFSPGDPYNGRVDGTDALQAAIGRRVDIVNWYQNWGGGSWIASVQDHLLGAVANSGRTPLITWEPWDTAAGTNQPRFSLSKIAGGDFDAYIATWATRLRALGRTVYLRPMHEMNGNWYPWAGSVNGNSPALYVQAWRRMHDIFVQHGASNVRWVWSPNNVDVPGTGSNRMEAFYPGAGYVDVLAVDGYNWGSTSPGNGGWQSFSQVFSRAYDRLKALGSQPIWIAEVGSAPEGGDKAAWIHDMFAKARTMDRLQAIVWFNENKERDWRADASPRIAAAFRAGGAQNLGGGSRGDEGSKAKPGLKLRVTRRARAGRHSTLRWKATRVAHVKTWHTYLNGRGVRVLTSGRALVVRKRISRAGRYRWTVVGRNAAGDDVVSASKRFRALRRR